MSQAIFNLQNTNPSGESLRAMRNVIMSALPPEATVTLRENRNEERRSRYHQDKEELSPAPCCDHKHNADGVLLEGFTAYGDIKVTLTCGGAGGGNVNVPYAIV